MNQTILMDAVTKHLDSIASMVNYAILISLAVAWSGLQRREELEALGLKFSRRDAFAVVCPLYLVVNLAILIMFLRIGDLLWLADGGHIDEAVTRLAVHPWIMNPFSYFGTTFSAHSYAGEGLGLLIVTWWLCNSSLVTLVDEPQTRGYVILTTVFLLLGLGTMLSIERVYAIALNRLLQSGSHLHDYILRTAPERTFANFLSIAIGVLLLRSVVRLKERFKTTGR
jgi:hypothetical protein